MPLVSHRFNDRKKIQWRIRYTKGGISFRQYFSTARQAMAFRMKLRSLQGGTSNAGKQAVNSFFIAYISYPERIDN